VDRRNCSTRSAEKEFARSHSGIKQLIGATDDRGHTLTLASAAQGQLPYQLLSRWTRVTDWGPLDVGCHQLETPELGARYFRLILQVVVLGSGAAGSAGSALVVMDPVAESVVEAEARARRVPVPDLEPAEPRWPSHWPEIFRRCSSSPR